MRAAFLYADKPIQVDADRPKDPGSDNTKFSNVAVNDLSEVAAVGGQAEDAATTSVNEPRVDPDTSASESFTTTDTPNAPASYSQPPPEGKNIYPYLPPHAALSTNSEETLPACHGDSLTDCCSSPYTPSLEYTSPPHYSQSTSHDDTHPPTYIRLLPQRRLSALSSHGTQTRPLGPRAPYVYSASANGTRGANTEARTRESAVRPRRQAEDGGIHLAGGTIQVRDGQPRYRLDQELDTPCLVDCVDPDSISSRSTLPPPYQERSTLTSDFDSP